MPEAMEIRTFEGSNYEIRESEDGKRILEGHAIKWEQLSVQMGWSWKFREKFQKGSFDEYLGSGEDTKFLVDHETGKVLGRSKKGTLTLKSDDTGLWYSLEIPKTSLGNDAYEDVRSGNKEHISVGFRKLGEQWDESDEANIIRTITKANLPEISLTAWPAYEQTTASARSIDDAYKEFRSNVGKPTFDTSILRRKLDLKVKF